MNTPTAQPSTRAPSKTRWNEGLPDEICFWEKYISTGGLDWPDEFRFRTDPESLLQETMMIERLETIPDETVRILDVGAGPLTVLGKRHPAKRLEITAVDPLADHYNELLTRAHIVPPVRTLPCEGERLLERFQPGTFDFAYARNALDHSYDPLRIILNMVAVVKQRRFVCLRHYENEGRHAEYVGLHQWNFDARHGEFVIWNHEAEHHLNAILGDSARVRCECRPDRWLICEIEKLSD
jgi:SAM-dependent methyltransferase